MSLAHMLDAYCSGCGNAYTPTAGLPDHCSPACADSFIKPRLRLLGDGRDDAPAWLAEHAHLLPPVPRSHRRRAA